MNIKLLSFLIAFSFIGNVSSQNIKKVNRRIAKIKVIDKSDPITGKKSISTWPPRCIFSEKKVDYLNLMDSTLA